MKKIMLGLCGIVGNYYVNRKQTQCCGIIGILSDKRDNIAKQLTYGVELLKNRGYDSAGIVTFSGQEQKVQVTLIKKAEQQSQKQNCIQRLVQQAQRKIKNSYIGIGHTRWATCGQKTQKNAHPHYDKNQKIYLVHNGIIGGYPEIKKKYLNGIIFNSETDSQVVAQLIGKFKQEGLSTYDSIKKTEQIIKQNSNKPQWGIVVIDKDNPHKIWTSTNGSPILIGMNNHQFFVASESIVFKKYADSYFVTNDNQVWELEIDKMDQIKQKTIKQNRLITIPNTQKINIILQPPSPYKSFYSYQIFQQGQLQFIPEFQKIKQLSFNLNLSFIACGSSLHAAMIANYFFKKVKCFQKISIFQPNQLIQGDIASQQTVVLISQSGETKDLINVMEDCKNIDGVKTIGIINVEGSTLARKVDFPIYIKVGREVSVAATKSILHQTFNLIQLALQVAKIKQSYPIQQIELLQKQLRQIPSYIKQTIKKVQNECEIASKLLYKKQSIYLLAMRQCMGIAKQSALKIKQLNYIHAEALGVCQMKHGPIALIQSDKKRQTAVILFILDNSTFQICSNSYDQMNSRNALIIIVTDCKQKIIQHYQIKKSQDEGKSRGNYSHEKEFIFIQVPKLEYFSCILALIPMQILVQKIAKLKGINPDMPRNLAKTVTV